MNVSILRKEARNNLKGRWKKALLIMLLFLIINFILSLITYWISINTTYGFVISVLNIAITVPLSYGLLASFIKLKRNEEVNYLQFIYYGCKDYKRFWKTIGRVIWKLLAYIFVWILSLYLMITEFVSLYYGYGMRLSYVIEIISVIVFSILIVMKSLYYSLNNYILYDNENWNTKEILKESERLMKNHRWDFVKMNFSFAGWFCLEILFSIAIILILFFVANIQSFYLLYITFIPLIFLLPYMQITSIYFYENLLYNNPKSKESKPNKKKKTNKKKANSKR